MCAGAVVRGGQRVGGVRGRRRLWVLLGRLLALRPVRRVCGERMMGDCGSDNFSGRFKAGASGLRCLEVYPPDPLPLHACTSPAAASMTGSEARSPSASSRPTGCGGAAPAAPAAARHPSLRACVAGRHPYRGLGAAACLPALQPHRRHADALERHDQPLRRGAHGCGRGGGGGRRRWHIIVLASHVVSCLAFLPCPPSSPTGLQPSRASRGTRARPTLRRRRPPTSTRAVRSGGERRRRPTPGLPIPRSASFPSAVFPSMISSWRTAFANPTAYFGFIQVGS